MESDLERFFARVLPSSGPYCIATIIPTRKGMTHRVCLSFQEMAEQSRRLSRAGNEVYFSIASYKDATAVNPKSKRNKAGELMGSLRFGDNANLNHSLVIDVDVNAADTKFYDSKDNAKDGVRRLVEILEIPEPIIVDSGGGLHLYWPLETDIPSVLWTKAAVIFKQAVSLAEPKLVADGTRVADCVGVLRVPETKNFKRGMPVDVLYDNELSYEIRDVISKCAAFIKASGQKLATLPVRAATKAVTSNFLSINTFHDFRPILRKCQWLRMYYKHRAVAIEPWWYAVLGLAKHCETPTATARQLMHMLSQGHPSYTYEDTEAKIDQVIAAQEGPTFCSRFSSLEPEWCKGCEFAKLVTTPARLPYVDVPAPPAIIKEASATIEGDIVINEVALINPPKPYFRGKEGGIYISGESEDGEVKVVRIYEYDIYPIARLEDEETGDQMLEIRVHLPVEGLRTIRIPTKCLVDSGIFAAELAAKGVIVHKSEAPKLVSYLIEYAKAMQREKPAQEEFTRFGWRDLDTDKPRFVMGDGVMDHKGVIHPASLASHLVPFKSAISTKGTIEEWKRGFSIYEHLGADAYRFTLMLAFAAPLFAFTPFHGLIFNLRGEGGSGKSTALEIMSSVWGRPNAKIILTRDTQGTLPNKMGYLQSIPVTSDELTSIDSTQIGDLAYCISEGRGKDRNDRSGRTRVNTVSWKTLLVSCSNLSLYEKLGMGRQGNNAQAYRIFEVYVPKANDNDKIKVDIASNIVAMNYGHAGKRLIRYYITHREEIVERLTEEFRTVPLRYNMRTAERFYAQMLATAKVGGDVGKELDLHNYNVDSTCSWAVGNFGAVRDSVERIEGDPLSIISDFLNINIRSTIHVIDGQVNTFGNEKMTPNMELHVRMEKVVGEYRFGYISQPAFKKYCNQNKIEYSWLIKRLTELQLVTDANVSKRLGDGIVTVLSPVMHCVEINLKHPSISKIVHVKDNIENRLGGRNL